MEAHDTGSVASTPTGTRFPQTPTSTRYPPTPTHGSPFAFTHPEEPPPAVPTHAIPRRAVNTSKKPPAKAGAKSRPPRDLPTWFSAASQFNPRRRSSTSSMQG
ncbi:hypothetical protein DIPPA_05355 [Diplonema papillatum]|nr:hypothetical protein DIPPA_05355 [Diplonema papillatum]